MTQTLEPPLPDVAPPQPPPHWALHLQPRGALLVDRRSLYYVGLSGRAAELALAIARTGTLDGAARVLAARENRPVTQVREQLHAELSAHPFTQAWEHGELGERLRLTGSRHAYIPILASLQLTNGCNLSCTFCYASSGRKFAHELGPAEWVEVIERFAVQGVAALTLTGGEPTLAPGYSHVLTAASSLMETVDVFTNGLAWSAADVALAAALGNVGVQVSIDGLAANHDVIRGRVGAYDATLDTMRRLAAAGATVMLSMTVTPANYRDVAAVLLDAAAAGVRHFRAGRTVAVGRAKGGSYGLGEEQVAEVAARLDEAECTGQMEVTTWDPCGEHEPDRMAGMPVDFRTPGHLSWHVRPDGKVTPCQIEAAPFGDITKESLIEIGAPHRLREVRSRASSCHCLTRVRLPESTDLPFCCEAT